MDQRVSSVRPGMDLATDVPQSSTISSTRMSSSTMDRFRSQGRTSFTSKVWGSSMGASMYLICKNIGSCTFLCFRLSSLLRIESEITFPVNNTYGLQVVSQEHYENSIKEFHRPGGVLEAIKECRELAQTTDSHDHGDQETTNKVCREAADRAMKFSALGMVPRGSSAAPVTWTHHLRCYHHHHYYYHHNYFNPHAAHLHESIHSPSSRCIIDQSAVLLWLTHLWARHPTVSSLEKQPERWRLSLSDLATYPSSRMLQQSLSALQHCKRPSRQCKSASQQCTRTYLLFAQALIL